MSVESRRQILCLAVSAGEVLLTNGAEISRVQETIGRILEAYGIREHQQYVLSNGIFVTLDERLPDACMALRNIPVSAIHLGRITAVNELSRAIEQDPDPERVDEYRRRLDECARVPHFPLWLRALCCAVGSGGFCYLFGGGVAECLGAFVCGLAPQVFLTYYGQRKLSHFTHTILGAVLVCSLAVGMVALWPALSLDFIIIGAIMSLVPGVALTTSIRDFFNGDFLSGSIHLIEAVLTGVCIAVGVGVTLQFWQFALGRGLAL